MSYNKQQHLPKRINLCRRKHVSKISNIKSVLLSGSSILCTYLLWLATKYLFLSRSINSYLYLCENMWSVCVTKHAVFSPHFLFICFVNETLSSQFGYSRHLKSFVLICWITVKGCETFKIHKIFPSKSSLIFSNNWDLINLYSQSAPEYIIILLSHSNQLDQCHLMEIHR